MTGLLPPLAIALAAAVLVLGRQGAGSVSRLGALTLTSRAAVPVRGGAAKRGLFRPVAVTGCGLAALVLVGGAVGAVAGVVVAVLAHRLLPHPTDAASVADHDTAVRDLPLALELLAGALRAGQPPAVAAAVVATAVGGPVGEALAAVARATALGSPVETAWQPLGCLPGAASGARALARAADNGGRLADELARTADDLRERRAADAERRVRRAGVLVVLPLGLCFLPAFVLVGVVPLAVGVAGSVLR